MRQIKFRAWCKTSIPPKMVDWETMRETTMLYEFEHLAHHYDWMQFTGLHDRNGKEIYEGDIVVYRDTSGSGRTREFQPRKVRWYRDSANFNVSRPMGDAEIEIIGNIYENPELLK